MTMVLDFVQKMSLFKKIQIGFLWKLKLGHFLIGAKESYILSEAHLVSSTLFGSEETLRTRWSIRK